jgi:DNA-binding NtrC family response regulator
MKALLIVDDERGSRESLRSIFERTYRVVLADNAGDAQHRMAEERFDLMLLDVMMEKMDGIALLRETHDNNPDLPIIMVSGSTNVRQVVESMKSGALDFVTKPFDVAEIRHAVARALETSALRRQVQVLRGEVAREFPINAVIGEDPCFRAILETTQQAAATDTTVLISGESGTGKELIARQLHALSERREEPFVAVHCGALPETLMESELFGHEKGAFTGADRRKLGRFDLAGAGTLFFDEVSEMPLATQVKLLRVVQEREYMRVGGTQIIRTQARIIAATNRDLKVEMAEKRFREDLYYRLNVLPIHIPPLRERPGDIPRLVQHYLQTFRNQMRTTTDRMAPDAMALLQQYTWPGNVRELRNVIERVLVLHGKQPVLQVQHLPVELRSQTPVRPVAEAAARPPMETPVPMPGHDNLETAVNAFERQLVLRALDQAGGVQTRAAEILGTTRRILKYRMDKLGLAAPSEV